MTMVSWLRTKKVVRKLVRKYSLFLRHGLHVFRHGLHGLHGFSCPCVSVVVPTDAMTRIFNRLDESVSSKQAEGLRKAEDGFRAIRVIRA